MSPVTLWPGFRSAIMTVSQFQATRYGVKKSYRKDKDLIMVLFVDPESGDGEKGPFQTISGVLKLRGLYLIY